MLTSGDDQPSDGFHVSYQALREVKDPEGSISYVSFQQLFPMPLHYSVLLLRLLLAL